MKKLLIIFGFFVGSTISSFAQWVVLDVANLQQSILQYAAMAEQIANQASQISNQIQQIRQVEAQLQRMGDMSAVRNIVGFSQFRADLNLPTQIRTWVDNLGRVDGRGLFGDTRGGIFSDIAPDFLDFDGGTISRDPQLYKRAHDVIVTIDDFKVVQSDVYRRREDLKRAIANTSDALQAASTEAEQKKLHAVLEAQYGQLAAVDAEVGLNAAEVQVKAAEANAMNAAHTQAEAETRRTLAQREVSKLSTTFRPSYECLLQYVSEQPLAP